jgi:hypothetical protein
MSLTNIPEAPQQAAAVRTAMIPETVTRVGLEEEQNAIFFLTAQKVFDDNILKNTIPLRRFQFKAKRLGCFLPDRVISCPVAP